MLGHEPLGPADTLKCVRQENPDTDQTHDRCNHFEHCKHPLRHARTKPFRTLHSQKDFAPPIDIALQVRISRNRCLKRRQENGSMKRLSSPDIEALAGPQG
jgi:hypothetical protein